MAVHDRLGALSRQGGPGLVRRWGDALEAADVMAEARHEVAGVPTTVIIEMKDRDAAIVSVYA